MKIVSKALFMLLAVTFCSAGAMAATRAESKDATEKQAQAEAAKRAQAGKEQQRPPVRRKVQQEEGGCVRGECHPCEVEPPGRGVPVC